MKDFIGKDDLLGWVVRNYRKFKTAGPLEYEVFFLYSDVNHGAMSSDNLVLSYSN